MNVPEILQQICDRAAVLENGLPTPFGEHQPVFLRIKYLVDVAYGKCRRSNSAVMSNWEYLVKAGKKMGLFNGLEVTDEDREALRQFLRPKPPFLRHDLEMMENWKARGWLDTDCS